jgi:pimeloyl-ACP methyl ester carboxylesterase
LSQLREHRSEVVVDGKRLETLSYPAIGGAHTIVMLHEGLGSISMWKDFPRQIVQKTHCGALVYSRYGHGKSERLAEKRPAEFMHQEARVVLPGLLAQFEIERPVLLGHSDGGSIAILHAASSPAKVRAMVLMAPHVFVEDLTVESIAKIGNLYRTSELPAKLARHHHHADEMFWGWNEVWLDSDFRNWNIEDQLDAIRCPVLLIQGKEDEYGTLAQVAAIQRRVQQTKTLVLSNCGHSPHRDQPTATLEAIAEFVGELS